MVKICFRYQDTGRSYWADTSARSTHGIDAPAMEADSLGTDARSGHFTVL